MGDAENLGSGDTKDMTRYRITTPEDTKGNDALASCFSREDAEDSKVALEKKFKTKLIIVEIKGQSDNRW